VAPRRYESAARRASVAATRKRIIDATLELHAEHGILGTSWKDIAERADVSVATVYKHYPSLDELVPACGAVVHQLTSPPALEDAAELFAESADPWDRLARLVTAYFDYYERGERYLEVDARERQLPLVQEWEAESRSTREGLVRAALKPVRPDRSTVRAVSALLDFPVFKSFRRQGVSRRQTEAVVVGMLACWLERARGGGGGA
jgi:AcrR family transcriptional regulator